MFLPDNTPAPAFSLKAEVSQRLITLQTANGILLLIFHGYQTASYVAEITRTVRINYPSPEQVLIAAVADLRIVPRLLRGSAKVIIRNAYHDAAKQIPDGQDPADHIIILADWNGSLFSAFQVPPTNRQVALVLVNDSQVIGGTYMGDQPAQAALRLLEGSLPADPPAQTAWI